MLFFLFLFFIPVSLFAGFAGDTEVRICENQYSFIKSVTNRCVIDSYSFDTDTIRSDISVAKKKYTTSSTLKMYFDGECVICSPQQLFFDILKNTWVLAQNLQVGDQLLSADENGYVYVTHIETCADQIDLYDFSIMRLHTFLITKKDVVVHNFFPFIGITILFGGGVEWAVTGGIALLGSYFAAKFTGKDKKFQIMQGQVSSSGFPDPDDDDPFKKWRHLSTKEITNKIAKKIAKELGFEETKDYNFNSHGQKVFRRGNDYITLDKTSHKGGFWKRSDVDGNGRMTMSIDLIKIVGK